jgi:hypothetical protein
MPATVRAGVGICAARRSRTGSQASPRLNSTVGEPLLEIKKQKITGGKNTMKAAKQKEKKAIQEIRQAEEQPEFQKTDATVGVKGLLSFGAILLILHGIIEISPILLLFMPSSGMKPSFIFDELAQNWQMTLGISIVSGLIRIIAAIGILKNWYWGWLLGMIISVITFTMLTFYLPMGVMDAIFSGGVLILLVIGRYPGAGIFEKNP